MQLLIIVIGWILTIFLSILALLLLYYIATEKIDLRLLISEKDGVASLSRFQFLIFTFVIAMSLFYLIAKGGVYPEIPSQILALLGISGGSYVVSKGIQTSNDVGLAEAKKPDAPGTVVEAPGSVVVTPPKSQS